MKDIWNELLDEKVKKGYLDRTYVVLPRDLGDSVDTRGWDPAEKVFCKINPLAIHGSGIATYPVSLDYTMQVSLHASPVCSISDDRSATMDFQSHFAPAPAVVERYRGEVIGKAVQETYAASVDTFFDEMRDGLRRAIKETLRRA
jgi:hypothetical protein